MSIFDVLGAIFNTNDMGYDWTCDCCSCQMNSQPGFTISCGEWTCTECGYVNDVSKNNVVHYGDKPASEAQLRYIKQIEELLNISFLGNTSEEASEFIDMHKDHYQAKLHTPYKYR